MTDYKRSSLELHSISLDLLPQDAPITTWNSGNNVFFRNGESVRAPGDAPSLPGATAPEACIYVKPDTVGQWVYCTDSAIFVHNGTTQTDITPAGGWSGSGEPTYSMCVLGGITYINASDRAPVYWAGDPVTPCQSLPDWPSGGRCYALRAHKNFLFAIGFLSDNVSRVRWSDAAEAGTVPQHWTPAADNLAGFLDLAPEFSPCWDGETLRDSFLIYKGEGVYQLDFIGGNDVFNSRILFAEYGISNTNAVTRGIDDVHLFVSAAGDVKLTDGQQVSSILDGRGQRAFYNDFTGNPSRRFSLAVLEREKLAYVFYPSNGSILANRCIIYDFVSGDIGYRDAVDVSCAAEGQALYDVGVQNEWDGQTKNWNQKDEQWNAQIQSETLDDVVTGATLGFSIVSNLVSDTFLDATPVEANLSKSGLAIGGAQQRSMINRVWPKVRGATGDILYFRFGGQEVTNGPITLTDEYAFTIGQSEPIDTFVQGRFMSVEVRSLGGGAWRMGTMDIEARRLGEW